MTTRRELGKTAKALYEELRAVNALPFDTLTGRRLMAFNELSVRGWVTTVGFGDTRYLVRRIYSIGG